jgi:hypothetical protein
VRAAGWGRADGQCALLGGTRWGRYEVVEGHGRPGVDEGRRGEMGPTRAAGRGVAKAGRAWLGLSRGGRRVGSGEPGWPVWEEQAAGCRRVGRVGKNKKMGGIHKLGAYVPRSGQET